MSKISTNNTHSNSRVVAKEEVLRNMASVAPREMEKLICDLEFENTHYVKEIEKERELVKHHELVCKQLEEETKHEQERSMKLDEDIKRLHKQFIFNRESNANLKNTLELMRDHETALIQKLDAMKKDNLEERQEQEKELKHYRDIWESYKQTYESFPLAIERKKRLQYKEEVDNQLQEAMKERESLKQTLKMMEGKFKPYTCWNDFIVAFAKLRVEAQKLEDKIEEKKLQVEAARSEISRRREEEKKKEEAIRAEEKRRLEAAEIERKRQETEKQAQQDAAKKSRMEALAMTAQTSQSISTNICKSVSSPAIYQGQRQAVSQQPIRSHLLPPAQPLLRHVQHQQLQRLYKPVARNIAPVPQQRSASAQDIPSSMRMNMPRPSVPSHSQAQAMPQNTNQQVQPVRLSLQPLRVPLGGQRPVIKEFTIPTAMQGNRQTGIRNAPVQFKQPPATLQIPASPQLPSIQTQAPYFTVPKLLSPTTAIPPRLNIPTSGLLSAEPRTTSEQSKSVSLSTSVAALSTAVSINSFSHMVPSTTGAQVLEQCTTADQHSMVVSPVAYSPPGVYVTQTSSITKSAASATFAVNEDLTPQTPGRKTNHDEARSYPTTPVTPSTGNFKTPETSPLHSEDGSPFDIGKQLNKIKQMEFNKSPGDGFAFAGRPMYEQKSDEQDEGKNNGSDAGFGDMPFFQPLFGGEENGRYSTSQSSPKNLFGNVGSDKQTGAGDGQFGANFFSQPVENSPAPSFDFNFGCNMQQSAQQSGSEGSALSMLGMNPSDTTNEDSSSGSSFFNFGGSPNLDTPSSNSGPLFNF